MIPILIKYNKEAENPCEFGVDFEENYDILRNYVTLNVPFKNDFRDINKTPKILAVYGDTKIVNNAAYFDGTGDYLRVSHDTTTEIGAGDFTVELELYVSSFGTDIGAGKHVIGTYTYGTLENGTFSDGWQLCYSYSGTLVFGYGLGGSWTTVISVASSISLNTWTTLALTRSGGIVRLFKNGKVIGTTTHATDFSRPKTYLTIGSYNRGDAYAFTEPISVIGNIRNVRLTKGIARYIGNFTPNYKPQLTVDFKKFIKIEQFYGPLFLKKDNFIEVKDPLRDYVTLLIPFEETVTKDKTYKNTITAYNSFNSLSAIKPYGKASGFFDSSSGKCLSMPYDYTLFDWWTKPYCIETWVYPMYPYTDRWSYSGRSAMIGNMHNTNTSYYWSFGPLYNGILSFSYNNGSVISVNTTNIVPANKWSHIAVQVIPPNIYLYIDGKLSASGTISGTPTSYTGYGFWVGNYNYSNIDGYLKDLRITKGVARYTGNFTPQKVLLPYNKL